MLDVARAAPGELWRGRRFALTARRHFHWFKTSQRDMNASPKKWGGLIDIEK